MNNEYTPLEYRIAIADTVGASDFRHVVRESDSNTDGAIYYRSNQLQAIGEELSLCTANLSNSETRAEIRKYLSTKSQTPTINNSHSEVMQADKSVSIADGGYVQSPTDGGRFSQTELKTLADYLQVEPDTPYAEIELRRLAGSSIAGPYVAKLLEASHVNIYISGNVGSTTAPLGSRAYYPHRLEQVHEIPKSAESHPQCHRYIVDSSYKDPTITNQDALDTANRVDAHAVILADEEGDMQTTIDAVTDGLEIAETHPFDGEVIIPLQPPHEVCYRRLREKGVSKEHTFAIGGYRDKPDAKKIEAAKAIQSEADQHVSLHGLGFGITNQMAAHIRSEPTLLDSVDNSTAIQNSIGDHAKGEERACSVAADTGAHLVEQLRKVSSSLIDEPESSTIGDYS